MKKQKTILGTACILCGNVCFLLSFFPPFSLNLFLLYWKILWLRAGFLIACKSMYTFFTNVSTSVQKKKDFFTA